LKNMCNQTVDMGPIDFHSMGKKIQCNSKGPINCLVSEFLQNIFFCVQPKKEIHTGLEQHKGE